MIPISKLHAARITAAKAGDFFLPREHGAERFLIATISGRHVVGIKLDGETPPFYFVDIEAWKGRRGLIVSDFEILVEPSSSGRYKGFGAEDAGMLVLDGSNVFIYAADLNKSTYPLAIRADVAEPGDDAVTFKKWSLITNDENGEPVELFSFG